MLEDELETWTKVEAAGDFISPYMSHFFSTCKCPIYAEKSLLASFWTTVYIWHEVTGEIPPESAYHKAIYECDPSIHFHLS